MAARRVLRSITPPVLVDAWRRGRRRRSRRATEWEFVPEGWARQRVDPDVTGWDIAEIRDAYRDKAQSFEDALSATGPLGVSSSPLLATRAPSVDNQNAMLCFAYALMRTARNTDSISVLDWGGGIGLLSTIARRMLPPDVGLDYHCRDLPLVCTLGREVMPDVTFHDDDAFLGRTYDLVMASSAIQYAEGWRELVDDLAAATGRFLFLTRVPTIRRSPSFVALQRVFTDSTTIEYLGWVFNQADLVSHVEGTGLRLVREFVLGYKPLIVGAPEQDETRGYLFAAPGQP